MVPYQRVRSTISLLLTVFLSSAGYEVTYYEECHEEDYQNPQPTEPITIRNYIWDTMRDAGGGGKNFGWLTYTGTAAAFPILMVREWVNHISTISVFAVYSSHLNASSIKNQTIDWLLNNDNVVAFELQMSRFTDNVPSLIEYIWDTRGWNLYPFRPNDVVSKYLLVASYLREVPKPTDLILGRDLPPDWYTSRYYSTAGCSPAGYTRVGLNPTILVGNDNSSVCISKADPASVPVVWPEPASTTPELDPRTIIKSGTTRYVDPSNWLVPSRLIQVDTNATLIFLDMSGTVLVQKIEVNGTLIIGTPECPIESEVYIVTNEITVLEAGKLIIHGTSIGKATAPVLSDALDALEVNLFFDFQTAETTRWKRGDKLILSSGTASFVREITSMSSKNAIRINSGPDTPLYTENNNPGTGNGNLTGFDASLLSRNIKISGTPVYRSVTTSWIKLPQHIYALKQDTSRIVGEDLLGLRGIVPPIMLERTADLYIHFMEVKVPKQAAVESVTLTFENPPWADPSGDSICFVDVLIGNSLYIDPENVTYLAQNVSWKISGDGLLYVTPNLLPLSNMMNDDLHDFRSNMFRYLGEPASSFFYYNISLSFRTVSLSCQRAVQFPEFSKDIFGPYLTVKWILDTKFFYDGPGLVSIAATGECNMTSVEFTGIEKVSYSSSSTGVVDSCSVSDSVSGIVGDVQVINTVCYRTVDCLISNKLMFNTLINSTATSIGHGPESFVGNTISASSVSMFLSDRGSTLKYNNFKNSSIRLSAPNGCPQNITIDSIFLLHSKLIIDDCREVTVNKGRFIESDITMSLEGSLTLLESYFQNKKGAQILPMKTGYLQESEFSLTSLEMAGVGRLFSDQSKLGTLLVPSLVNVTIIEEEDNSTNILPGTIPGLLTNNAWPWWSVCSNCKAICDCDITGCRGYPRTHSAALVSLLSSKPLSIHATKFGMGYQSHPSLYTQKAVKDEPVSFIGPSGVGWFFSFFDTDQLQKTPSLMRVNISNPGGPLILSWNYNINTNVTVDRINTRWSIPAAVVAYNSLPSVVAANNQNDDTGFYFNGNTLYIHVQSGSDENAELVQLEVRAANCGDYCDTSTFIVPPNSSSILFRNGLCNELNTTVTSVNTTHAIDSGAFELRTYRNRMCSTYPESDLCSPFETKRNSSSDCRSRVSLNECAFNCKVRPTCVAFLYNYEQRGCRLSSWCRASSAYVDMYSGWDLFEIFPVAKSTDPDLTLLIPVLSTVGLLLCAICFFCGRGKGKAETDFMVAEMADNFEKKYEAEQMVFKGRGWVTNRRIGQGSFGTVYEALTDSGTIIAAKIMFVNDDNSEHSSSLREIQNEFNLISGLIHPNLTQYFRLEELPDQTIALLMEYMPEGSLSSLINRTGCLPLETCKKYTVSILKGLEFMHQNSIVHRDIKGDNVLLSNGGCKLSDFGSIKLISDSTKGKTVLGTPRWMAPEVINSDQYGEKADIWSVGCTICEMLTGDPPWPKLATAWQIMYHIAETSPVIPPEIDDSTKDLLGTILVSNPDSRPSATALLETGWAVVGSDESSFKSSSFKSGVTKSSSRLSPQPKQVDTTGSSNTFSPLPKRPIDTSSSSAMTTVDTTQATESSVEMTSLYGSLQVPLLREQPELIT
eukprot:TRINITY_DN3341_c0_g2_i1.p1 TRINITY_DN3341_c0_g2~~TRINITY_DN3341_c0_g2_i1.p1  ORF type:complete len:1629 (+),score=194.19 TRINITY_DN3341_c0_g2_i1:44-4930(+)